MNSTRSPHLVWAINRTRPSPGLRPPSPAGEGLIVSVPLLDSPIVKLPACRPDCPGFAGFSSILWFFDQDVAQVNCFAGLDGEVFADLHALVLDVRRRPVDDAVGAPGIRSGKVILPSASVTGPCGPLVVFGIDVGQICLIGCELRLSCLLRLFWSGRVS